jgi:hypothetical protein
MSTKAINPEPDSFTTDYHASLRQQILNISRSQCEMMVRPNGIGDDVTRKTEALQARHVCWNVHRVGIVCSNRTNNLAITPGLFRYPDITMAQW